VLLAAHRLLWEAGSEIPLVLAGIPAPGESFDFSQPGVNVAQRVPHDAVMSAWVNATVGVVPSMWSEPFGLVAVECLAAGTPLVVSRVGGLADIVDGERYGLTFDRGNPAQLAEGIHRLLRDRELSARLAAAGKRRALDFTASAVGREMEKLYRRALDSRSRN
jgi:glycosyltransferase involved in cell wall biosynthesis